MQVVICYAVRHLPPAALFHLKLETTSATLSTSITLLIRYTMNKVTERCAAKKPSEMAF
jgi:hypothetical protein